MLRVEHLNKKIMDFSLTDVCFHLPKGYIMGLVGVNASGKSTLIKTLINIYHKDSGKVYVDGLSMDEEEKIAKNMMGIVLDENYYERNLCAEENAKNFGKYFECYNHDEFLRYCRQFHVDTKKKLKRLSKGQHMKFQIAFALSHNAKLFIMDEPTANLDQAFRQEFMDIMQDLIADGEKSILLATHQTDTLDQIADYITLLHEGNIVFSMSKEILMDKYILVSGEESKINGLPERMVVYRENGIYNSMALIYNAFDVFLNESGLTMFEPTIEELMYFMVKGGLHSVEFNLEKQLPL
ncbi:MAG: transporter, ATP-binding protein [Clostridiales bacterium]|jgi:ABC-2 type transport system ATP-binding protein|nr:transporter, ATP-binding protein [Clostridiales bacterium]